MNNVKNYFGKQLEIDLKQNLKLSKIPEYMHSSIFNYLIKHIPTGSFLKAVLSNDLKGAVTNADSNNFSIIPDYVSFFYNWFPLISWGSIDNYNNWVKKGE